MGGAAASGRLAQGPDVSRQPGGGGGGCCGCHTHTHTQPRMRDWQRQQAADYCELHNNRPKTAETSAIRVS
eukprot:COSAG06_NODE_3595_length_5138_cov_116.284382_9_plen_71_part_00